MSTPFQNRLVGTVMVAAAAVIFLPDLLDGKKQQFQADFQGIPQAPSVIDKPTTTPFPKEVLANIPKETLDKEQALNDVFEKNPYNQQEKPLDDKIDDSAASEQKNAIVEPAIDETKVKINTLSKSQLATAINNTNSEQATGNQTPAEPEEQWVVQLGSFRHQKNVEQLEEKLIKAGFKVFTKPIKTKNGSLTKVFVGPEIVKTTLEQKLPELKQLTQVDGKVSRYKVSK